MFDRWMLLLIVFTVMLLHDLPKLRNKRKEKVVYYSVLAVCLYLGVNWASPLKMPHLYDIAKLIFGTPAKLIVEGLKAKGGGG